MLTAALVCIPLSPKILTIVSEAPFRTFGCSVKSSVELTNPGKFQYSNSATHLNAHALFYASEMTPHQFASRYLFPHLGIEEPRWDHGYLNINDGATNLYLNLRDMVKLGQLYIQNGYSGSNQ